MDNKAGNASGCDHNGVSLGFSVWYYQYILPSSTLSFKYGHFWILKNQAGNQTDQKKTPI